MELRATPGWTPKPQGTHRAIVAVPEDWTTSPAKAEAAARAVFAAWFGPQPGAPRDVGGLVRGVRVTHRQLVRQETQVAGRRLAWRTAPAEGRATPVPDIVATLDPWAPPADLDAVSRHTANCATCATDCRACAGEGRHACVDCGGDGKQPSTAREGKLINCKRCRGRGDVDCPSCVRRSGGCVGCAGSGKVDRWLGVDTWTRVAYAVSDDAFAGVFPWTVDSAEAWRMPVGLDAEVVAEVRSAEPIRRDQWPTQVPAADRDALHPRLRPNLMAGERIVGQTVQVVDLPSISVSWGIGRLPEVPVEFLGRRLLGPPGVRALALQRRAEHLKRVLAIGVGLAILTGMTYALRGAWYRTGYAWGVFGSALAVALLVYGWRREATLGRRAARRWLLPALAPLAAIAVFASLGAPDRDHARASLKAGRLDEAQVELEALGSESDHDLVELYADLRLAKVRRQTSSGPARALLQEFAMSAPQRVEAVAFVDGLLLAEGRRFLVAHDVDQTENVLTQVTQDGKVSPAGIELQTQVDAAAGERCLSRTDWLCAAQRAERLRPRNATAAAKLLAAAVAGLRAETDRAKDNVKVATAPADKVAMLTAAELALRRLEQVQHIDPPSAELVAVRAQLAKAEEAQEAVEAREAKRQAAAEAREAREEARQSRRSCCKYCSTGCACGDSCISCSKTCHKGPGCAC